MKNKSPRNGSKESFRKFILHPIVLLVLGASTALLGQWLATTLWQRREWDRQQRRLLVVKNLDQKYEVPQELIKAAKQNDSVVSDYLFWLETREIKGQYGKDPEGEHAKILENADKDWHAQATIIEQKLKLFYKTPEIQSLFDKIQSQREQIAGNAYVLHAQFLLGEDKRLTQEMKRTIRETNELLVENYKQVNQLIAMMTTETNHDIEGS